VLKKMNYFGDQLLGGLGLGFTFDYENGIEKSTFDMAKRKNIYLIYKEAINNAAKYSGAKNVRVALSKEGRQYEMEIADNGRGFDTSSSTMGNGLRNMKRRAEEMGGKLTVESTVDGTYVQLSPLRETSVLRSWQMEREADLRRSAKGRILCVVFALHELRVKFFSVRS